MIHYCNSGMTAFHLASKNGHLKIAELIVQKSAEFNIDLDAKTDNGMTAFHFSCQAGHFKIAELIMKKSAEFKIDLNTKVIGFLLMTALDNEWDASYPTGETALHLACRNGHSKIVEMIVQNSADFNINLNVKTEDGMTAFHFVCKKGHFEIADFILQKSAEFNIDLLSTRRSRVENILLLRELECDNDIINRVKNLHI